MTAHGEDVGVEMRHLSIGKHAWLQVEDREICMKEWEVERDRERERETERERKKERERGIWGLVDCTWRRRREKERERDRERERVRETHAPTAQCPRQGVCSESHSRAAPRNRQKAQCASPPIGSYRLDEKIVFWPLHSRPFPGTCADSGNFSQRHSFALIRGFKMCSFPQPFPQNFVLSP